MCMECYCRAVLAVNSGIFVFFKVDPDQEPDEDGRREMDVYSLDTIAVLPRTRAMLYDTDPDTRQSAVVSICEQMPSLFVPGS